MIVYTNKYHIPFFIDDDDYEIISYYSWFKTKNYIGTTIRNWNGPTRQRLVYVHQLLLGFAPIGMEWDHKDRNPLNNHRNNLHIVTHQKNQRNTGVRKDSSSGVKGVHKFKKWWVASIKVGKNNRVYLGIFNSLEEAARARRKAEIEYWN